MAGSADGLGHFPRLIEIESYEPEVAVIGTRNETSGGSVVSVEGSLKAGGDLTERKLTEEFCRFYKLV